MRPGLERLERCSITISCLHGTGRALMNAGMNGIVKCGCYNQEKPLATFIGLRVTNSSRTHKPGPIIGYLVTNWSYLIHY